MADRRVVRSRAVSPIFVVETTTGDGAVALHMPHPSVVVTVDVAGEIRVHLGRAVSVARNEQKRRWRR